MKTIVFVSFLMFSVSKLSAQKVIPAETAAKHIGQTVKIYDKVFSTSEDGKDQILKLGGTQERQCLAVIIKPAEGNNKMQYTGHNVYVTGKLTKYKGGPAIIVTAQSQLRLAMVDRSLQPALK